MFFRHGHCHRPSAVQGTQVGSCQDGTPGWDQWDHPSQHQLWTRWYVYRAKVLRVVESGEQLDSIRFIDYGNRDDLLPPTDLYTWDTRLERVLSQTVSCCFYRALSQVRERASLTLDGMEAFTLLMKQSSPMLMFVHEHLSPPHVMFSLIHHQFGPELSVSLRGKDGRDILTKFSHLPEFDVYQASCQLSKNA